MKQILCIGFLTLTFSACSLLDTNLQRANDSGELKRSAQELAAGIDAKQLAAAIVDGLAAQLNDPAVKLKLDSFITHLLSTTGNESMKQMDSLKMILASVLDEITVQALKSEDTLLGKNLQMKVHRLKMELLGSETDTLIAHLIRNAKNELLDADTRSRLDSLRDDLLGYRTNQLISTIVDSAVSVAIRRTDKGVSSSAGIIERHAKAILFTAGGIIAALLGIGYVIWRRKQR